MANQNDSRLTAEEIRKPRRISRAKHARLSKFGAERAEYLRSARAHTDLSTRTKFVALARSAHRDLMRERLS